MTTCRFACPWCRSWEIWPRTKKQWELWEATWLLECNDCRMRFLRALPVEIENL